MARDLEWRNLKTGIVAFAAIAGLAISILLFARVGALRGETTGIYVVTDDAPGVLEGTEVWLSGQKVGLVRDIHFRPVTADTLVRLAIHLQILSDRMRFIRRDAWADIRPGGNLIGSPVVWISSGTSKVSALQPGDTLVEVPTGKMQPVGDRVARLGARMNALADSGGKVLRLLQSQAGTAGRLVGSGWPRITRETDEIARLSRQATRGEGTLALMLTGELGTRLSSIRARKDSITVLLSSGEGNVGRFRRDSTLMKDVLHLQAELDSLRAMTSSGAGIGKMKTDSSLTGEMARIRVELALLMTDLKKRPLRYLKP